MRSILLICNKDQIQDSQMLNDIAQVASHKDWSKVIKLTDKELTQDHSSNYDSSIGFELNVNHTIHKEEDEETHIYLMGANAELIAETAIDLVLEGFDKVIFMHDFIDFKQANASILRNKCWKNRVGILLNQILLVEDPTKERKIDNTIVDKAERSTSGYSPKCIVLDD